MMLLGFSSKLHYNVFFPDTQFCLQSSEPPVRHLQAAKCFLILHDGEFLPPASSRMHQQNIAHVCWE